MKRRTGVEMLQLRAAKVGLCFVAVIAAVTPTRGTARGSLSGAKSSGPLTVRLPPSPRLRRASRLRLEVRRKRVDKFAGGLGVQQRRSYRVISYQPDERPNANQIIVH